MTAPEMSERDKLIEQVGRLCTHSCDSGTIYSAEEIADFILADRARIVEPLEKRKAELTAIGCWIVNDIQGDCKAMDESLRRAGRSV